MTQYQLYGLYCPDTDILKYIGITKNGLQNRLNSHLRKPTNEFISSWFNDLKLENKKPLIKLIKECRSYEELLKSEIDEITKYRELKFDLFNKADG
jgi:predicted GIY-YIG superfamily endonuclease